MARQGESEFRVANIGKCGVLSLGNRDFKVKCSCFWSVVSVGAQTLSVQCGLQGRVIYIYIYIYTYTYRYLCVSLSLSLPLFLSLSLRVYTYMYISVCIGVPVSMSVFVHVSLCVCLCVYQSVYLPGSLSVCAFVSLLFFGICAVIFMSLELKLVVPLVLIA